MCFGRLYSSKATFSSQRIRALATFVNIHLARIMGFCYYALMRKALLPMNRSCARR